MFEKIKNLFRKIFRIHKEATQEELDKIKSDLDDMLTNIERDKRWQKL